MLKYHDVSEKSMAIVLFNSLIIITSIQLRLHSSLYPSHGKGIEVESCHPKVNTTNAIRVTWIKLSSSREKIMCRQKERR